MSMRKTILGAVGASILTLLLSAPGCGGDDTRAASPDGGNDSTTGGDSGGQPDVTGGGDTGMGADTGKADTGGGGDSGMATDGAGDSGPPPVDGGAQDSGDGGCQPRGGTCTQGSDCCSGMCNMMSGKCL